MRDEEIESDEVMREDDRIEPETDEGRKERLAVGLRDEEETREETRERNGEEKDEEEEVKAVEE